MLDPIRVDRQDHMVRLQEVVHQKEITELLIGQGLVLLNLTGLQREVILLQDLTVRLREGLLRKEVIAHLQDRDQVLHREAILLLPEVRALQEVIVRLLGRAHLLKALAHLQGRDLVLHQGAIVLLRHQVLHREASVHLQDQVEVVPAAEADQAGEVEEEDKRSG